MENTATFLPLMVPTLSIVIFAKAEWHTALSRLLLITLKAQQWKQARRLSNVAAHFYEFTFKDNQRILEKWIEGFTATGNCCGICIFGSQQLPWSLSVLIEITYFQQYKGYMFLRGKKAHRIPFLQGCPMLLASPDFVITCNMLQKKSVWNFFFKLKDLVLCWEFCSNPQLANMPKISCRFKTIV